MNDLYFDDIHAYNFTVKDSRVNVYQIFFLLESLHMLALFILCTCCPAVGLKDTYYPLLWNKRSVDAVTTQSVQAIGVFYVPLFVMNFWAVNRPQSTLLTSSCMFSFYLVKSMKDTYDFVTMTPILLSHRVQIEKQATAKYICTCMHFVMVVAHALVFLHYYFVNVDPVSM